MTRSEAIEAMARAMYRRDFGDGEDFDVSIAAFQLCKQRATAAYDALQPHIQGERERCAAICDELAKSNQDEMDGIGDPYEMSHAECSGAASALTEAAAAIRALDTGGQDDG